MNYMQGGDTHIRNVDLRALRDVAAALTAKGAALYDLLGKEEALRVERQAAISRNVDISEVETQVFVCGRTTLYTSSAVFILNADCRYKLL